MGNCDSGEQRTSAAAAPRPPIGPVTPGQFIIGWSHGDTLVTEDRRRRSLDCHQYRIVEGGTVPGVRAYHWLETV